MDNKENTRKEPKQSYTLASRTCLYANQNLPKSMATLTFK
jgi:hypothetical protein